MIIPVFNVAAQSQIVIFILLAALLLSSKKRGADKGFSHSVTTELKGVAIFFVVLSHIGYFLVTDHRFLTPLSNYAGVGVDLFLLLSGYGLVASALRQPLLITQFYKKRLVKTFLPVVVTVLLFFIGDFLFLHRTYPFTRIAQNIFGFFPSADLYNDSNSPLWFITPLLFYYLVFPLLFSRRFPIISAAVLGVFGWWFAKQDISGLLNVTAGIANLYQLHLLAFPVGMAVGALFNQPPLFIAKVHKKISAMFNHSRLFEPLRYAALILAAGTLLYTLLHTAVGEGWRKEELVSVASALIFVVIFILKTVRFRLLSLFGAVSFEIYLLHWPLLYSYNTLFHFFPAGAATLLSLALLVVIGLLYQKMTTIGASRLLSSPSSKK